MVVSTNPTASHSPAGQYPSEKICEEKSCWRSCLPARRSHSRTVLSRPPVHSLLPSGDMSIQLAPSVCPWNWLQTEKRETVRQKHTSHDPTVVSIIAKV